MKLTDDEKKMAAGEYGEAVVWAMDLLTKMGDYYGAENLVDVQTVYLIEGFMGTDKSLIELTDYLVSKGGRFRATTMTHVTSIDYSNTQGWGIEADTIEKQARQTDNLINKMGALPCRTCTMYWVGVMPRFGEHIAVSESSATVMFNSVVGARTNFEGFPSSIASGLTGRTVNFGFHLDENRRGNALVQLDCDLELPTDWDALGFYVGNELRSYDIVPIFENLPRGSNTYDLKRLAASLATGPGSIGMFHAVGITPEATTVEQACHGIQPTERLNISRQDLEQPYEMFSGDGRVDLIHFGCPHLHLKELAMLAEEFTGNKKHPDVRVWLFTAPATKAMCDMAGYTKSLEDAGCEFFTGTCTMMMPTRYAKRLLGNKVQVSDSIKQCYYSPRFAGDINHKTILKPTKECVKIAIRGRL